MPEEFARVQPPLHTRCMKPRGLLMILFVAATLAVDLAVISRHPPHRSAAHIAMACLMLSQISLLAVWSVAGSFSWRARLSLLALGIWVWSLQWDLKGGVPTIDMVCLLSLVAAMVAVPLGTFQRWSTRPGGTFQRQVSLAALFGSVTVSGVLLGLTRQFSRPDDLQYLSEMVGIATATSLTTLAAVVVMLGPRLNAWHLALVALVTGVSGLILSATIMGTQLTAWTVVSVHTVLVAASLTVWRICGVRLQRTP